MLPAGAALVAAAITLFVFFGTSPTLPSGEREPGLDDLIAAARAHRIIEPRVTGGFDYARLHGSVRAGEPADASLPPDIRIAVARIEKAAAERRLDTIESLGIAYLVIGESGKAIPLLEELVDLPTPTARPLSDLAAAYLVRASTHRQPQDFATALATADRAVRVDPGVTEAWFNRALALERLFLSDQAIEAWRDYLKADSTSGWATEARSHLAALTAKLESQAILAARTRVARAAEGEGVEASGRINEMVRQWPHATREWVEEQVLATWPRLVMEDRVDEARALIARVVPVVGALAETHNDAFLHDVVAAIVASSDDQAQTRSLADAHHKYQSAWTAYQQDRIAQSATAFADTLPALDRAKSPLGVSARFYRAVASYYIPDLALALAELQPVATLATERSYTRLLGLVHRTNGLIDLVQARFGQSLDHYRAALTCFQRAGDVENEAGIRASLAENLDFIGDKEAAWAERHAGLSQLGFVHDPRRRHTILVGAALASLRQELPETALHFQHAALGNASRWGRPPALIDVHLNRAHVYDQLGKPELAEADLAEAQQALAGIEETGLLARSEARILVARGQILTRRQPLRAIEALDKARRYFEHGGANWTLARVHLARGRAQLAAGHDDLAEADFLSGIHVFERMRASLSSEALRSSYFEQPWDLFTEMIELQAVRRKRPDRALNFAEQARARTLLEAVSFSSASLPSDSVASRERLPDGVSVIYYAALDERLLIWVLTRTALTFVNTPVGRGQLGRLVDQYRNQPGPSAAGRENSSLIALYDALIRPIESALQPGTRLALVPDGVLHAVPFAALLRRETRRYMVEDYALQVTPSLTVFQMATKARSLFSESASASALVVGNPQSRSGASNLANLPAAESEATDIAAMYPNAELLLSRDATKSRFLSAAGKHAVVHFAGHAIPNEDYPGLSRLLLSGEGDGSETLFAHEIANHRFDRTRLVILAACRTNVGRIRRGEGVFSLARPFIAAGVPAVVASLTDVDDRASHRLFVAFHRALRKGQTATDALRSAQLSALTGPDPFLQNPANWASFTVIGGVSALVGSDRPLFGPAIVGTSNSNH